MSTTFIGIPAQVWLVAFLAVGVFAVGLITAFIINAIFATPAGLDREAPASIEPESPADLDDRLVADGAEFEFKLWKRPCASTNSARAGGSAGHMAHTEEPA